MSIFSYNGHDMARSLASVGISTFLVPDSSIYALMSRVNKVIIGAHAILANGGMFAATGALLAATAARAHSTPVVVCAGQFKLTPLWNLFHEYGALDFADPSSVLGFEEGHLVDKVDVLNPYFDYVQPELIDVYITNEYVPLRLPSAWYTCLSVFSGDHPPSSIYRFGSYVFLLSVCADWVRQASKGDVRRRRDLRWKCSILVSSVFCTCRSYL
jgi:translation initiation factor eIF-2B subunit beta